MISRLPLLYPTVADRAWKNSDSTLSVEFDGETWKMVGVTGSDKSKRFEDEPLQYFDGIWMTLILIERAVRFVRNPRAETNIPIRRINQCRIPLSIVTTEGSWVRPETLGNKKQPR